MCVHIKPNISKINNNNNQIIYLTKSHLIINIGQKFRNATVLNKNCCLFKLEGSYLHYYCLLRNRGGLGVSGGVFVCILIILFYYYYYYLEGTFGGG